MTDNITETEGRYIETFGPSVTDALYAYDPDNNGEALACCYAIAFVALLEARGNINWEETDTLKDTLDADMKSLWKTYTFLCEVSDELEGGLRDVKESN